MKHQPSDFTNVLRRPVEIGAKGGHPELSDQEVEAAGEYLLTVTFPEKPRD